MATNPLLSGRQNPGAGYQYWGQEYNDPIAQQAYKEVWLNNSPDAQKMIDQSVEMAESYRGVPGTVFNSSLNPLNWGSGHIYNSPELRQKYIDLGGQAYNAYDYHAATDPASVGQPYYQDTGKALSRANPATGKIEYPTAMGNWKPAVMSPEGTWGAPERTGPTPRAYMQGLGLTGGAIKAMARPERRELIAGYRAAKAAANPVEAAMNRVI